MSRETPRKPVADDADGKPSGGRDQRVYLEPLKTTLPGRVVRTIIELPGLRSSFACTLGCCEMRGFEELIGRGREHYLWTRHAEIEKLRGQPSRDARINRTYEELVTAREHGRVVRRVFESNGIEPPNLSLLDRWIALLARHAERLEAA